MPLGDDMPGHIPSLSAIPSLGLRFQLLQHGDGTSDALQSALQFVFS
jgi:hypothetical protein